MTGLQPPPADLSRFPERSRTPSVLYRIFFHRGRDGQLNSPWRFSARPADDNRFELTTPKGTCYWSDRGAGAFVEVFRGLAFVDPSDVTRRRLFVAQPPRLRLADVTSKKAYLYGVTAEVSTSADYRLPQLWAAALEQTGREGLWATCRHDPSSTAHNVAVFGTAGSQARRRGWTLTRTTLDAPGLLRELAEFGVSTRPVPIPYRVATVPPPA